MPGVGLEAVTATMVAAAALRTAAHHSEAALHAVTRRTEATLRITAHRTEAIQPTMSSTQARRGRPSPSSSALL